MSSAITRTQQETADSCRAVCSLTVTPASEGVPPKEMISAPRSGTFPFLLVAPEVLEPRYHADIYTQTRRSPRSS